MGHLALVPPPGAAPVASPRKRRGRGTALSLTLDEARTLRASIRGLVRSRYGTVRKLAAAIQVDPSVLTRKRRPSPGIAVALWRETGIPLEQLLSGRPAAVPALPVPEGGAA